MRLYLHERPRTFILCENSYALILRHPYPTYKTHHHHIHTGHKNGTVQDSNSNNNEQFSNKVIVEFVKQDLLDLSSYKDITPTRASNKKLLGFLGLLNVKSNIYLGFVTENSRIASPTINENILRIEGVDFYCLNNDEYDHLINRTVDEEHQQQIEKEKSFEYPATSVRKLLSSGSFFYSTEFDITSNCQERGFSDNPDSKFRLVADSVYYKSFMWNSFMNSELIDFRNRLTPSECEQFDKSRFLITIARGYAQTVNTILSNGEEALLTLITKQSCGKSGPLFGDWGCDDSGFCSNFAETEVIIYTQKFCFAYVILRGNVPTFWHLESHFTKKNIISSKKNKKIVFPRSFEASQHAMIRHFDLLSNHFGEVHIINSISNYENSYKGELSKNYRDHVKYFNENKVESKADIGAALTYKLGFTDIPITKALMKKIGYKSTNPHDIVPLLVDSIIEFGAMFYDISANSYIGKQLGIFRVNSFDSLNKANFVSKIISQEVIELAFRDIGVQVDHDLFIKHSKLWAENEDFLSKITLSFVSSSDKLHASSATSTKGTVKSHLTKKYLRGVVEAKPSETAMLKLLGRLQDQVSLTFHNPIHDYVRGELSKRSKEFSSFRDISVFASTFNVNGSCFEGDIKEWLFPLKHNIKKSYDIVFIGFEEIVELSAGQMVNTNSENRYFWEKKIQLTLNTQNPDQAKYVSLWGGQLGGIALLLYVKESEVENISNVEGGFKKTGLGGVSANKGGVAVSFTYANTELCFVSSHLAAGLSNVIERHQNYKTIARMKFSKNRRIKDHDAVLWLGDFNYRIDLLNEQVKSLVELNDYTKLFEFDQLNKQMAKGESFPFFDEMEIKFPPTYKFDNGTKTYDTSEKQRIPAWTDRILNMSRNKIVKQLLYDCAEDIIFSDHRPVYAVFKISVNIINESIKKRLSSELYENYRKKIGDINEALINSNNISLLISDINDKVLPPPSSELKKWWLDVGKPIKVSIPELNNNSDNESFIINPRLPINPFEQTMEPEFIKKKELTRYLDDNSQVQVNN